ncbi:MAG: DUF488 domain-containing protein [Planctomycetota bacterium]
MRKIRAVPDSTPPILTIGHSNHTEEVFLDLLSRHRIDVLADVRSHPYSRYNPHFNRESLQQAVKAAGVRYLFLGDQLGGRPEDEASYDQTGHVLYWRVAESPEFLAGIERLERGRVQYRVALMCSEEDPAVCHRYLLVSRVLTERGGSVEHVRGDGTVQKQQDVDRSSGVGQGMLFADLERDSWKSLLSVLPKAPPSDSLVE